jgi:hypothetical protein
MRKRVAKAWISPDMLERLNRGETVTINIPPDVCQLRLSFREGEKDLFDDIFDGIFRNFFRKFTSRTLR